MGAQAHVKERPEQRQLPLPNTDFYEVTEALNGELGLLEENELSLGLLRLRNHHA